MENLKILWEVMERYGIDVSILSVPMPVWYFKDAKKMSEVVRSLNEFGADTVRKWPSKFGVLGNTSFAGCGSNH